MQCKICSSQMNYYDSALLLGKYYVKYYKCNCCGYICTEEAYWLEEAYSDAIASTDIGLIGRNIYLSDKVSSLLKGNMFTSHILDKRKFSNKKITCLDYGAGYGMFVRLMRDRGFDFYWYDKYCTNLFAKTFEGKEKRYDLLTAFELFEHFDKPLLEIDKLMNLSDTIVFSTCLIPDNNPKVEEWWYFSLKTGQHISFYSERTLEYIAKQYHRYYYHYGDFHVFTKVKISEFKFKLYCKYSKIINLFIRRKSLLSDDYEKLTNSKI